MAADKKSLPRSQRLRLKDYSNIRHEGSWAHRDEPVEAEIEDRRKFINPKGKLPDSIYNERYSW